MDVLCESKIARLMPKWMRVCLFIIGTALLTWVVHGLIQGIGISKALQGGIIGVSCVFAAGYRKKMYLSSEGIVKETQNWKRSYREVLSWKDVQHVTLVFRGNELMCFFEKDFKGWKVLFDASQENKIRDILSINIPKTEIAVMHKSKG